jgi:4,5-dihydroxyphthalate decarboxylase
MAEETTMKPDSGARAPHYVQASGPARLGLTLAMTGYDHVRDLTDGLVQPQGIALTPLILPIEEIFFRQLKNLEFDIAETSFAKYLSLTAAGDAPIVGIPVFPSRVFRHSAIYLRTDSGISDPKGLEGRTVGIPEWAQTAGVYVRGLLAEYYDVQLERIRWVQAGVNQPGRQEKATLSLPASVQYESRPDKSLSEMLLSGEIDAAITARPPDCYLADDPRVVRLFPAYRAEEQAYFQATGIFPIMHVVTIRRGVLDADPWVAMNMLTAFEAAKNAAVDRLRDITASRIALPWGAVLAEEIGGQMGGDLWPYGVEPNRTTLDAFCRFAYDQHITPALLRAEELFPVEVRHMARV